MAFIRSISGLRATLGDALTPALVADYVSAFCTFLPEGAIVLGRDGRPSGSWIEAAAIAAVQACGREARMLGIVPTPTVQMHAEAEGVAGAISISASHNPAEYNGLKFLDADGLFLRAAQLEQIWEIVDARRFSYATAGNEGSLRVVSDPLALHIEKILQHPLFNSDKGARLERIRHRRFKVVVDAVNASGSVAIPRLLQTLGCECVELYCDSSGVFPHAPEPLPQHLGELATAVKAHSADIGFAVDPDADRLVIIDNHGKAIGEENTIVLAVRAVMSSATYFSEGSFDALSTVINYSTTRAVDDVAAEFGGTCRRAAVGEINVVDAMLTHRSAVGGEGSGGVIVPQIHPGRDSLVGCAIILDYLAGQAADLAAVVAGLPRYAMLKHKVAFSGDASAIFANLEAAFTGATVQRADGIRLEFKDSWIHVRASNTEPILRIIAEAPEDTQAQELVAKAKKIVGS